MHNRYLIAYTTFMMNFIFQGSAEKKTGIPNVLTILSLANNIAERYRKYAFSFPIYCRIVYNTTHRST